MINMRIILLILPALLNLHQFNQGQSFDEAHSQGAMFISLFIPDAYSISGQVTKEAHEDKNHIGR